MSSEAHVDPMPAASDDAVASPAEPRPEPAAVDDVAPTGGDAQVTSTAEQQPAAGGGVAKSATLKTKKALLGGLKTGKLQQAVAKMEADEEAAAQPAAAAKEDTGAPKDASGGERPPDADGAKTIPRGATAERAEWGKDARGINRQVLDAQVKYANTLFRQIAADNGLIEDTPSAARASWRARREAQQQAKAAETAAAVAHADPAVSAFKVAGSDVAAAATRAADADGTSAAAAPGPVPPPEEKDPKVAAARNVLRDEDASPAARLAAAQEVTTLRYANAATVKQP